MRDSSTPSGTGYANGPVVKPADWHGLVAVDVFLNNVATGTFLVAALADLAAPHTLAEVARIAYAIALIALLVDLICLVLDLGDPWRFHHMMRVCKPSSPMSLGVWSLTLFSFPLTVLVAIDLLPQAWGVPRWLHLLFVVMSLLPAFGSVAYKGVLFSTSAQPGWCEARWLGAYLVSSALALGCTGLLALTVLFNPERVRILRQTAGLLIALSAVPLVLVILDIRAVLARHYNRSQLSVRAAVAFGGEIVLPLVLLAVGSEPVVLLAAVLCFFIGAQMLRIWLVQLPHAH
jgi:formate-dependent nitrite reductase membrane component NrfD